MRQIRVRRAVRRVRELHDGVVLERPVSQATSTIDYASMTDINKPPMCAEPGCDQRMQLRTSRVDGNIFAKCPLWNGDQPGSHQKTSNWNGVHWTKPIVKRTHRRWAARLRGESED